MPGDFNSDFSSDFGTTPNVWTGAVSSDANVAGNWSLGRVPVDTDIATWDGTVSVVNCTLSAAMLVMTINVLPSYTGTITLGSYAVSGGDMSWNVGDAGTADLVANGGFETPGGGSPDVFASWAEGAPSGSTILDETTITHAGTHAAKLSYVSATPYVYQDFAATPANRYRLSFWCRGDGAQVGRYAVYDVTNAAFVIQPTSSGNLSTTWQQKIVDFTCPTGCASVRVYLYGPNATGSAYWDDVSCVACGQVNFGSSTITCSGNFSWASATGTITRGTSTVVMTGTGKTFQAPNNSSPARNLYAVTFDTGCSVTVPNTVGVHYSTGLVTINGALTYNASNYWNLGGGVTQGANGTVAGSGILIFAAGTLTFANPSAIAPATLKVYNTVSLPAGTYSPTTGLTIYSDTTGTFTWAAGTYTFTCPVTLEKTGAGTFTISGVNNPTLILQSSLTVTQATGTITFSNNSTNPNQLTGTANQTINLSGKNMGTWVVNKPAAGAITWTSGDTITAGGAWTSYAALTIPTGVSVDFGDGSYTHSITGDVTLSGAIDNGNSKITTAGKMNCASRTSWTDTSHLSTLEMTGIGKTLTTPGTTNADWGNVTIAAGASVTATTSFEQYGGAFAVNGTFTVVSGKSVIATRSIVTLGAGAKLNGSGTFFLYHSSSGKGLTSLDATAEISVAAFLIRSHQTGSVLAPGSYLSATYIDNDAGASNLTLSSGDYVFQSGLYVDATIAANMMVDCATNNPNITVGGNFRLTQSAGTLTYTAGSGTLTLTGGNSTITTIGKTLEAIVVNKTATANRLTLADSLNCASFTLTQGTLVPSGKSITTTGAITIGVNGQVSAATLAGATWTAASLSATGEEGDLLTLNPAAPWTATFSGRADASYVNVANSNAGGGSTVFARKSTNSGSNTNWAFYTRRRRILAMAEVD